MVVVVRSLARRPAPRPAHGPHWPAAYTPCTGRVGGRARISPCLRTPCTGRVGGRARIPPCLRTPCTCRVDGRANTCTAMPWRPPAASCNHRPQAAPPRNHHSPRPGWHAFAWSPWFCEPSHRARQSSSDAKRCRVSVTGRRDQGIDSRKMVAPVACLAASAPTVPPPGSAHVPPCNGS